MTTKTDITLDNANIDHNYRLLREVTGLEQVFSKEDIARSEEVLGRFTQFSEIDMQDANLPAHREGLTWKNGEAKYPKPQIDLIHKHADQGFMGISADQEQGGSDVLNSMQAVFALMGFKNNPQMYLKEMVTTSAINALREANKAEADPQKREATNTMIEKLITGEYTGAMVLTEPKGGSNLGSEMEVNASYAEGSDKGSVSGIKNYITGVSEGGTRAENVISLVVSITSNDKGEILLDRKGRPQVSVSVVPKYKLNEKGETKVPKETNGVTISEPYKKEGIRPQILTAVEYKDSEAMLLGQKGKGWQVMFGVMNPARLKVAAQGFATAYEAFERASNFATSKGLDTRNGVPIVQHAQINERLHEMRSYALLGTSLLMEAGKNLDLSKGRGEIDEAEQKKLQALVELQTPMLKLYGTERGKKAAKLAVDVMGAPGFTSESIPKMRSDIEPATFYEGTNQMMARNVATRSAILATSGSGKPELDNIENTAMGYFIEQAEALLEQHQSTQELADVTAPLKEGIGTLRKATEWLMEQHRIVAKEKESEAGKQAMANILAGSEAYTMLFGDVSMAVQSTKICALAHDKLKEEQPEAEAARLKTQIHTAEYFNNMILDTQREMHLKTMMAAGKYAAVTPDFEKQIAEHTEALQDAGEMTLTGVREIGAPYRYGNQAVGM